MDKDRIEGGLKEAGGKVKEAWGDATDNPKAETEGNVEQAEGNIQQGWGEAKDDLRDTFDDDGDKTDRTV